MRTRKIYFALLLLFLFFKINGQTISPVVLQDYQKDNMWCWAASIGMIAKYQGMPQTQCDVAKYRLGRCCSCPSSDCFSSNCTTTTCSRTQLSRDIYRIITRSDFLNFNAKFIQNDFIKWDTIIKQITQKTPFILGVYEPSLIVCSPSHFVVAKGISTSTIGGIIYRKMLVNDPYCVGTNIFDVDYIDALQRPCSYIYNISKKTTPTPTPMMFVSTVDSTSDFICPSDFKTGYLTSAQLQKLIDSSQYKSIPVDYCEYDKFNILQKCGDAIDLVYNNKCNGKTFVTRFEKNGDMWYSLFSFIQNDEAEIPVKAFGKSYILDNKKGNDTSSYFLPFRKVIFRPQPFEFYKFTLPSNTPNKIVVFTPAHIENSIKIKNTILKKGDVLLRKDFIKLVKRNFYATQIPILRQ